jgi:hypothetical protein
MKTLKTIFAGFLLALVFFSQSAWAENDFNRCNARIVKAVGKHFKLDDFFYHGMDSGSIIAGVCKQHPQNQQWMIAAFAYDAGVEYEKTLLLSVIDVAKNRVVASYKETIEEDGGVEVHSDSLRLDTGRYNLSKTTRAFGVRLNISKERCGHQGGYSDEFTLFIMKGNTLKPVFSETMHFWAYSSTNRCGGEENEDDMQVDANTTLSIEPTSTKGFADLRLIATRSDTKKSISAIVKYNGESYDLKPWKKVYGAWGWDY